MKTDEEVIDILCRMDMRLRIQHLNFEKDRLKRRFNKSLKEINRDLKHCRQDLCKYFKEHEEAP